MGADGSARDRLEAWVRAFAAEVTAHRDELTQLDAAIGDADHGSNLARGMAAVVEKFDADSPADGTAVLKTTGMTMVSTVGGASGPLYGTLFLRMATAVADELDVESVAAMLRAGLGGIEARGHPNLGDKTMYDALAPACTAFEQSASGGGSLADALGAAASAAAEGRDATVEMQAKKGRASYLGERSVGHQDPGATSATMLIATAAQTLA